MQSGGLWGKDNVIFFFTWMVVAWMFTVWQIIELYVYIFSISVFVLFITQTLMYFRLIHKYFIPLLFLWIESLIFPFIHLFNKYYLTTFSVSDTSLRTEKQQWIRCKRSLLSSDWHSAVRMRTINKQMNNKKISNRIKCDELTEMSNLQIAILVYKKAFFFF